MKISDYLRKREFINWDEKAKVFNAQDSMISKRGLTLTVTVLLTILSSCSFVIYKELQKVTLGEEASIAIFSSPVAATSTARTTLAVPAGSVNLNPFLPYRDLGSSTTAGRDIPAYDLVEPPESVSTSSDAVRVMDTIVSGILYDKYSPSAILNIEGNDYLVKKHDKVNNYEVLNITSDSVTVKLGANIYKAGIGEILTEGTLNHNNVSNLNNKFGGAR